MKINVHETQSCSICLLWILA